MKKSLNRQYATGNWQCATATLSVARDPDSGRKSTCKCNPLLTDDGKMYHAKYYLLNFRKNYFMRKLLVAASLLMIASLVAFKTGKDGELPIGASLPKSDIKMKDVTGKEVSFQDAKKQNGLLVMFSCNTCPYVIRNQSRTREICQYAAEKEIGVMVLNSNEGSRDGDDSFDEMKAYAKDQHYNWYYVVDRDNVMADAFGANRTPECFLFDKSGKLVYHGAIDDNPGDNMNVKRKHLQQAMEEMLAGKEVSIKTSRSVGCGIKRI